jgi:redox-sensitive bicupin YhaK (pirin superfamily)
MSWQPGADPILGDKTSCDLIEMVIVPRVRDLGGFEVRRALPSQQRQMVGPFIFFDQAGPAQLITGKGIDIRPHPHIGLATVTYLFEGEMRHLDSLGTEQTILPGDVNWMTSGKGIVHSERSSAAERTRGAKLYGIQSWVALPKHAEETDPGFFHHDKADLPFISAQGKEVRLIAGSLFGQTSPVETYTDMFYADAILDAGATLPLPAEHEERGIYIVEGSIEISGDTFGAGRLLVLRPHDEITIVARQRSRIMLLGGEPMDGPRHIWWNLVSSSKERIDQAKEDWKKRRFDTIPGDEEEFTPLPE